MSTRAAFIAIMVLAASSCDASESSGPPSGADDSSVRISMPTTPTTASVVANPAPSITDSPSGSPATANPSELSAGSSVVVTPASVVNPACNLIGALRTIDEVHELVGQLKPNGEFVAGPPATWLACAEAATANPIEYTVPANVEPGDYLLCVTEQYRTDACAELTIVA